MANKIIAMSKVKTILRLLKEGHSKRNISDVPLDTMIDKHIWKRGTERRESFENELRIDLLGQAIKQARKQQNLTQEQLGELVGVLESLYFEP